jgi:hypothetical protein
MVLPTINGDSSRTLVLQRLKATEFSLPAYVMADFTSGQDVSVEIIIYVEGHYQRAAQLL